MQLKKLPIVKHLPDKKMKIREKIGDIKDRMKMYNIHLIGVIERQIFKK